MTIESKLCELGLELPPAASPAFEYVPVVVHRGIAYVSGQLPKEDGEVRIIALAARLGVIAALSARCSGQQQGDDRDDNRQS